MPQGLSINGCQHWHTITQAIQVRLFHVRFRDKKTEFEKVIWTSDLHVLERLYEGIKGRVLEVNLFSPPYLNGTDSWKFDPLDKVISLSRMNDESETLVGHEYQLSSGTILYDRFDGRFKRTDPGLMREELDLSKVEAPKASSNIYQ